MERQFSMQLIAVIAPTKVTLSTAGKFKVSQIDEWFVLRELELQGDHRGHHRWLDGSSFS